MTSQAPAAFPNGARFLRCALQVNPFAYQGRHGKQTAFKTEAEYNQAMVEGCKQAGIDVIAVTDHYRVKDSKGLVDAARAAGLWALMGFEAVTKDGVHLLCIFDHDDLEALDKVIGQCGIIDARDESPIGELDVTDMLGKARDWGAVMVAAHVAAGGGLLRQLSGQSRVNAWRSPDLLACSLPGPVDRAPQGVRDILRNRDASHKRTRPVAVLNTSDVNCPEELGHDRASCLIKMSTVTVEGLRQAFLDPESRVRLLSDEKQEPRMELLEMSWQGGFLDGNRVQFNPNLNALVGGRGAGKSTIIESLRYAFGLEPIGEEAKRSHQGIVNQVIQAGTKVSVSVRSHQPAERRYTVERTVPNPPVVKDESGAVLSLPPAHALPGLEVFGQHEVSEFAKDPEKTTKLLRRFMEGEVPQANRKTTILLQLERSRGQFDGVRKEMLQIEDALSALPGLEETQKRFREAGVEDKLKERRLLVKEEAILESLANRLETIKAMVGELGDGLPIDAAFVSAKALEGLPNADLLNGLGEILQQLSVDLGKANEALGTAFGKADHSVAEIKASWQERCAAIEKHYESLLRELQAQKIDGTQYIELTKQLEHLGVMKGRMEALSQAEEACTSERHKQLLEWEELNAEEYRGFAKAAKLVSKRLSNKVKATVTVGDSIAPLEQLLHTEVGGNLTVTLKRLGEQKQLSMRQFAEKCREGKQALIDEYRLTPASAQRLAEAGESVFMKMEGLELPIATQLQLNVGTEREPEWRAIDDLSKGQQATAILLVLLLESSAPLVIDQPEDDLDNRFITEGVVPVMRLEKQRRQFLFSTHNANIPVLGDAELIVGLTASGGKALIQEGHHASIDSEPVKELVEEVLEGGETAFEMRRSKYGF